MKRCLFCLIFLVGFNAISQNMDSLFQVAKTTKNDSIKFKLYNKVAFNYIFNNKEKALHVITEGRELAQIKEDYYGLAELTNTYGIYMDVTGRSDSAKYYFEEAMQLSKTHGFIVLESKCLNNLGMFHWNKGNFKQAQDFFFQSLKMDEDRGDRVASSIRLNNIGLIYQEMNLVEKALEYHQKSYEIRTEFNLKKDQAASLNNIGICLKDLKRFDEALESYNMGLEIAKTSENLIDYYKILENIGAVYDEKGDNLLAAKYYKESINVPPEVPRSKKNTLITLGKLAGVYNKLNKHNEALKCIQEGEQILKEFPHFEIYSDDLVMNSAETYYRLGDMDKGRLYMLEFVRVKDSTFSQSNAKAIADLETKYQTEKKEKEILSQRASLAENELKINKQNIQILGLAVLAIVLLILGYFFYTQQKLKNKQLQKEQELKTALSKIETQNKLQDQRLRISRDLHDNIGAQLTFIISSIDNLKYGFKIKNEKLTDKLLGISSFTKETIYELRDTIWAMNKSEITLEDLQTRISNFIDKANVSSLGVDFSFVVDSNVSKETMFTSVEGMNVYRIIQEAVNNAIKHAKATRIMINVEEHQGKLTMTVSDNGIGLDLNEVIEGNGLNNMKKRALEIDASFDIKSNPKTGTRIILQKKK